VNASDFASPYERPTFRPTEVRDIHSLYEVRAAKRQNAISKAQLMNPDAPASLFAPRCFAR